MTEPLDIEQFLRDLVLEMWIASAASKQSNPGAMAPEDVERVARDLLERYPPVKTGTGYDVAPFVQAASAEFGFDAVDFVEKFRAGLLVDQEERAAVVKAVEELLRGDG